MRRKILLYRYQHTFVSLSRLQDMHITEGDVEGERALGHWQLLVALVLVVTLMNQRRWSRFAFNHTYHRARSRVLQVHTCNGDKILPFKTEFDGRVEEPCQTAHGRAAACTSPMRLQCAHTLDRLG